MLEAFRYLSLGPIRLLQLVAWRSVTMALLRYIWCHLYFDSVKLRYVNGFVFCRWDGHGMADIASGSRA